MKNKNNLFCVAYARRPKINNLFEYVSKYRSLNQGPRALNLSGGLLKRFNSTLTESNILLEVSVKFYENAETLKSQIMIDNNKKSGIYK